MKLGFGQRRRRDGEIAGAGVLGGCGCRPTPWGQPFTNAAMLSGHEFRAFCKLPMRLPKLVLRSQGGLTCPTMALHQDPDVPYQDWQCSTSRALDGRAAAEHRRTVGPAELALLRVLLLRRLWFPLLLALARCRSRRPFDVLGDHVAACPRAGVFSNGPGLP